MQGSIIGVLKGDTGSLDYSSHVPQSGPSTLRMRSQHQINFSSIATAAGRRSFLQAVRRPCLERYIAQSHPCTAQLSRVLITYTMLTSCARLSPSQSPAKGVQDGKNAPSATAATTYCFFLYFYLYFLLLLLLSMLLPLLLLLLLLLVLQLPLLRLRCRCPIFPCDHHHRFHLHHHLHQHPHENPPTRIVQDFRV